MSRHRDVRNMDYTEDYDGYDDVYGHSVDDDYYISPSNRQFIFNRENSRDQPKIGEFIRTEQDIQEEDESDLTIDLSDLDKAKLESCLEQVKTTLGPINISKSELANVVVSQNYDVEKVTNAVLNDFKNLQTERKEKDVRKSSSKFFIPQLNGLKLPSTSEDKVPLKKFSIPPLSKFKSGENVTPQKSFTVPKITKFSQEKPEICGDQSTKFTSLSDLVSSHLSKSFKTNVTINSTDQIDKISDSVDSLKITKPELPRDNSISNQYQIDLSVALKSSPSTQSLPNKSNHNLKEEKFEIPFVDCDVELERKTVLKSSFDIKEVLNMCLINAKPVSNFGKVLCYKYRKHRQIKIKHNCAVRSLKRFNFSTPSPDDNIIKHLKI